MIESVDLQNLRTTPLDKKPTILKQQLVREIACLERQLERVKEREQYLEDETYTTYQEMIDARRRMLHNMPWDED